MSSGTIAALDLETTGLDPEQHHIWEIGLIVRGHRDPAFDGEWHWMIRPRLADADPHALRVGRYYERAPRYITADPQTAPAYLISQPAAVAVGADRDTGRREVAYWLARLLDGASIIGINPQFDTAFLARFMRGNWQSPTWHHRLVDVVPLVAGFLAGHRSGYNFSAAYLQEWHNGAPDRAGCTVPAPDRDTTEQPAPPWRIDELSGLVGVDVPGPADRHTALGDARWALALYDRVMTP